MTLDCNIVFLFTLLARMKDHFWGFPIWQLLIIDQETMGECYQLPTMSIPIRQKNFLLFKYKYKFPLHMTLAASYTISRCYTFIFIQFEIFLKFPLDLFLTCGLLERVSILIKYLGMGKCPPSGFRTLCEVDSARTPLITWTPSIYHLSTWEAWWCF